jgi:hypothetical protein
VNELRTHKRNHGYRALCCAGLLDQIVDPLARGGKSQKYENHHQIWAGAQLAIQKLPDVISQNRSHRHQNGNGGQDSKLSVRGVFVIPFFIHALRPVGGEAASNHPTVATTAPKGSHYNFWGEASQAFSGGPRKSFRSRNRIPDGMVAVSTRQAELHE